MHVRFPSLDGNGGRASHGVEQAYVRADPALRRHFALGMLAAAVLGAFVLVGFRSYLAQLQGLADDAPEVAMERAAVLLQTVMTLAGATAIGAGVYAGAYGVRIRRAGRFPPPGARVLRDTRITEGAAAAGRGALLIVLGALAAIAGAALPLLSWQLLTVLRAGA